jgi:type II secretory pathway pseudopilin PulG
VVNRRRGTLLIELLAAMILFSVALTVLAAAIFGFARSARADFEERVAREAAAGMLERWDALGDSGAPFESLDQLRDARCETRTTPLDTGASRVEVSISWPDIDGRPRTVRAETGVAP